MNSAKLPVRSIAYNPIRLCADHVSEGLPSPYNEDPVPAHFRSSGDFEALSAEQLLQLDGSVPIRKLWSLLLPQADPDAFMAVVIQAARGESRTGLEQELEIPIPASTWKALQEQFTFSAVIPGRGTTLAGIIKMSGRQLYIPCLLDPPNDFGGLFAPAGQKLPAAIRSCWSLAKNTGVR